MKFSDLWTPWHIPWENTLALVAIVGGERSRRFTRDMVPRWFALPSLIIVFGTFAAYFLGEYNGASNTNRARRRSNVATFHVESRIMLKEMSHL